MEMILTFIFFTIVGFYLLGLVGRLALTYWIRKKQKEFENGTGPTFKTYGWGTGTNRKQQNQTKKEGEVTVESPAPTQKKINKNVGDYVEYEEVKETKND